MHRRRLVAMIVGAVRVGAVLLSRVACAHGLVGISLAATSETPLFSFQRAPTTPARPKEP